MKRSMRNLIQAIAIVRQLRARPTSWLSDVGRGPVEKSGSAVAIKRSVRGLSIRLDNGSVVAWTVPAAVARLVCQWCVVSSTPVRVETHQLLSVCIGLAKDN